MIKVDVFFHNYLSCTGGFFGRTNSQAQPHRCMEMVRCHFWFRNFCWWCSWIPCFFSDKNTLLGTNISLPKDDFPFPKVGCVSSLEGRIFHKSSHRNLHKWGSFQQNLRHCGDLSSSLNSKPKSFRELKGPWNLTYCRYSKYLHLTGRYLLQGPSFSISNLKFQRVYSNFSTNKSTFLLRWAPNLFPRKPSPGRSEKQQSSKRWNRSRVVWAKFFGALARSWHVWSGPTKTKSQRISQIASHISLKIYPLLSNPFSNPFWKWFWSGFLGA